MVPEEEKKIINISQPIKPSNYILANLEMCGFYRVNYDLSNWDRIIRQLKLDKNVIFINFKYYLNNIKVFFAVAGDTSYKPCAAN